MELKSFFNPKSIAIIGVSSNPLKVGHLVAKNMIDQGFSGELYFIHPTETSLLGKSIFKDLKSLPKKVDLIIFATPADVSLPMLDEVAASGCKNVLIFAAGFKENHTKQGDSREALLLEKVKEHKLNVLGPNCIGFVNTMHGVNATFLKDVVKSGNIGIMSQSGALGSALTDYFAAQTNLGVSYFMSLGNKSVMDESDVLEFLANDENTKVIGMYLEDVAKGDRFREVLIETTQKKPVVILKSGRTEVGSQAAVSHTGSMVGNDDVFDSVVKQAGAIRSYTFSHFEMILKLFSFDQIPLTRNILVLSNAGGMGVMLADELIVQNLNLVTVSEQTKNKLYKAFDEYKKITVHNPIDLLGDASAFDYEKAVKLTTKEVDVGAAIVLLTPQANTQIMETASLLIKAQNKTIKRPLYPVFMGGTSVKVAHTYFEQQHVASFRYFSELPPVLSKILENKEYKEELQKASEIRIPFIDISAYKLDIQSKLSSYKKATFLNQYDSIKVIEYSGIPVAKTYLATKEEDLTTIISQEGFPLVAKVASDKITHKTEVKGVVTGLNTWDEQVQAYDYLIGVGGARNGCYIQKEYKGHEFIIGAKRDVTFGPVVLVGLGGIYAELLKETIHCVYPFNFTYFSRAIRKTKMKKLFEGYRNSPPVSIEKLYEIASKIGALMHAFPSIKEIDINPLIASGEDMITVDARIIT